MTDDRPLATGEDKRDAERDSSSGALVSRPTETGLGAAASGVALGAPPGEVIAAMVTKDAEDDAELIDNDKHWRDTYSTRSYVLPSSNYDDYAPAYRYGSAAYAHHAGRSFDEVEPELASSWSVERGSSGLDWSDVKQAVRDAWQRASDRLERAMPGDSDRDGK